MELKKAIYTIEEAAKLLACQPEQLLSDVITKKWDLFVRSPEHLDIYNVGRTEIIRPDLRRAEGERYSLRGPQAHRVPDIDFLVIPNDGLRKIANGDLYMGSTFYKGGTIDANGEVAIVYPETPQFEGKYFGTDCYLRHYATYRAGIGDVYAQKTIKHPQKFAITSSDLLISRPDVKELGITPRERMNISRPLGFPVLDVEPYTSQNLQKLYALFCQTWEGYGGKDFVLPEPKAIFRTATTELGFSDNLAGLAVRAIYTDVMADHDDNTGAPRIVARLMNSLIRGSIVHWKHKLNEAMPNPANAVVAKWFRNEDLDPSPAKVAATMIRPNAPKGRKPEV